MFQLTQGHGHDCDAAVSIEKTHSWNMGYIAKVTVDQTWLSQQTLDWTLNITFCNNVTEFKVNVNIINSFLTFTLTVGLECKYYRSLQSQQNCLRCE